MRRWEMTTRIINTFTAPWSPRWIVRNARMRKVIESIFVVNSLYCFTTVHEWGSAEMYTFSNTALGRKRKNRFFLYLKPPRFFFITSLFFQTCASDHSHRAMLSRPLTLLAHLCFLLRLVLPPLFSLLLFLFLLSFFLSLLSSLLSSLSSFFSSLSSLLFLLSCLLFLSFPPLWQHEKIALFVYFQQNKKRAKAKGKKKCHTKTMRGRKKPVQRVHKRTPHVPLRQNVEE